MPEIEFTSSTDTCHGAHATAHLGGERGGIGAFERATQQDLASAHVDGETRALHVRKLLRRHGRAGHEFSRHLANRHVVRANVRAALQFRLRHHDIDHRDLRVELRAFGADRLLDVAAGSEYREPAEHHGAQQDDPASIDLVEHVLLLLGLRHGVAETCVRILDRGKKSFDGTGIAVDEHDHDQHGDDDVFDGRLAALRADARVFASWQSLQCGNAVENQRRALRLLLHGHDQLLAAVREHGRIFGAAVPVA